MRLSGYLDISPGAVEEGVRVLLVDSLDPSAVVLSPSDFIPQMVLGGPVPLAAPSKPDGWDSRYLITSPSPA